MIRNGIKAIRDHFHPIWDGFAQTARDARAARFRSYSRAREAYTSAPVWTGI